MSLNSRRSYEYYEEIRVEQTKLLKRLKSKILNQSISSTDHFEQDNFKNVYNKKYDPNFRKRESSKKDRSSFEKLFSTDLASQLGSVDVELDGENTLDMYCYSNYNQIISSYLSESVYSILAKVMMEFVTLNLYLEMKNQMRKCLLNAIKNYLIKNRLDFKPEKAPKIIKQNLNLIQIDAKTRMIKEANYSVWIANGIKNELFGEYLELKSAILIESRRIFNKLFLDEPKKARLKLNLISSLSENQKDYCQLNRASATSFMHASAKKGQLRMIGRCILVKFYFPSLVYKADLMKPSKNKFLRSLLLNGSSLNRAVKSMTGLLFALIFTYLIYSYLR
jgi:hypothetical protein